MARYLVTGGCGFIGSHLVERLLANGDTAVALDNMSTGSRDNVPSEVEVVVGDVRDAALVARLCVDVDGCFHLAAVASVEQSMLHWRDTHQVNLGGAIAVLDAVRRDDRASQPPVVYASSAAVYGDTLDLPLSESARPRPLSAYGADKLGCELHARVGAGVFGIRSVGFRFFNVYGPRQDPRSPYTGVISIFARRILDGKPITINGDGAQTRDFVYVADAVNHLLAAMRDPSPDGDVFNVCTGRATTINKLAAVLREITGNDVEVVHGPPRTGDIRHSLGSPTNADARFGVPAGTDLKTGLEATLAWMRGDG